MGRKNRHIDALWLGLLSLAALVLYTTSLGDLPLRDWDEGTVAQVAKEIYQAPFNSMTWLYPTLHGEPYLNKPPLMHWLMAIAFHRGGINEWTARLPGALLSACAVPLLYSVGGELFQRRTPAVFAALVYLTLLPVARHGRLAMLDGAVICFSLVMIWCALRSRRDGRFALGVGLALSLVCMTKGIMLALLMGSIAIAFLLWDTPRLLTSLYLWLGMGLGLVPVALWYSAQWLYYGEQFLDINLLQQSFWRIGTAVEGHDGPPWYYLLEIVESTFPWLLFIPLSLRLAWDNRTLSWARLTLVWSGFYLVAISAMSTKLPWYVLPLYPAIALMLGVRLSQFWSGGRHIGVKHTPTPYSRLWVALFLFFSGVSSSSAYYFAVMATERSPHITAILGCLGLTLLITAILAAQQNPQFLSVLTWGTYLSLLLLMMSPHWVWELAEAYPVKPVAALLKQHTPEGQLIHTSYPYNRPSLNFYSDRQVIPANLAQLRQLWNRRPDPYFLLEQNELQSLHLPDAQSLGTVNGWTLTTKGKGAI